MLQFLSFTLTVLCIPTICATQQVVDYEFEYITVNHLNYSDDFQSLPNMTIDYIALAFFSIIGVLVLISTCYEFSHSFVFEKVAKSSNDLYSSFSLLKNTRCLITFKSRSNALECLDGIRAISIIGVVVGHTFVRVASFTDHAENRAEVTELIPKLNSLWITMGSLCVDTFFMMSGLLNVYTFGKKTRWSFVKNIHILYLHRYLRLLPLLATAILLQASLAPRIAHGPELSTLADNADNCRQYWWTALLYVQNYVNVDCICIPQSWYLSVDMQLYWISPVVVMFVCAPQKNDRRKAWFALALALFGSLLAATIFCFWMNFPSNSLNLSAESDDYMRYYYVNTLTRAPPFFVGMIHGYVLHLRRDTTVKLPLALVSVFWAMAVALICFALFVTYPTKQSHYGSRTFDNFCNSFVRTFWAAAIGWTVFACVHGYGGPINWLLSLRMWKLPARLSYGMYLLHSSLMFVVNGRWLGPLYFPEWDRVYDFFGDVILTFVASFIVGIVIDLPFTTLQKHFFVDNISSQVKKL